MTEAEWLSSTEAGQMLLHVRRASGRTDRRLGGHRKLRLFNCACCRRVARLLPDQASRAAVAVAERFADGAASDGELADAAARVRAARAAAPAEDFNTVAGYAGWAAAYASADRYMGSHTNCSITVYLAAGEDPSLGQREDITQATLVRCVFGNPFRPVTADPSWLTPTVLALAAAIYEDRAFDRLPVLADALEEAGCNDDDVLIHCRGDGPHVRGCWVVDLVLGKE